MKESKPFLLYILIILCVEKFIQHMVVTYAFFADQVGIRNSVAVDYRILMISGFIVGILFMISIPLLYQRRRFGFKLLFFLALFDFIGEFIAQGTLFIDITVSFVVASAILIILIFYRKRFV
ncbi:MAG: hypothetical protein IMY85_07000 [Chloroflexi bacterium]|nr:hypothetical protein [Chloroflexota bacterium]